MPDESKRLTAFNVRTKEKNVKMFNVKINKNTTGKRVTYVALGKTEDNTTALSRILSASSAQEAIDAGVAEMGTGW